MNARTAEFMAQYPKDYGARYSLESPDYDSCAASVLHGHSTTQCARKNGKGPHGAWCGTHDPLKRKAKADAAYDARVAEYNAERRQAKFAADCQSAIRDIAAGADDPRALALSIIANLEAPE